MLVGILYPLDFSLWSVAFLGGIFTESTRGWWETYIELIGMSGLCDARLPGTESGERSWGGDSIWAFFVGGWWRKSDGSWVGFNWWKSASFATLKPHMIGWFVDSYGIIVGKYTIFPDGSYRKYHFLTKKVWCASRSWSFFGGMFFFFWGGGGVIFGHSLESAKTNLWGVAWLTCLWSPLVCTGNALFFV